jgi:thiamine-phosphate pyrophosphorylase
LISPPRLYIVTDRRATQGRPLDDVLAAAARGIAGSPLPPSDVAFQLRDKDLSGRALIDLGRRIREIATRAGVRFYVNGRFDIALALGADGVHLGADSLPVEVVRRLAPGLAIGVSAHALADVAGAAGRADFAVFGPIRDTPSKRAYGPPVGWAALAKAAAGPLPLLALGGIEPTDVRAALEAGARGVACIRGVLAAHDPAAAAQTYAAALAPRSNALGPRADTKLTPGT